MLQNRLSLHCEVQFPALWINASRFDLALRASCGPHDPGTFEVTFEVPSGCKIMVEAAIRFLSLANQLAATTRRVRMKFEEGDTGTMGYLNRMGFFDHLAAEVEVLPSRPAYSAAEAHRGGNAALVEIARISKDVRDEDLPTRLTAALMRSCHTRPDAAELEGAAWTIFAELIDNVFSHSSTLLDGYAALQVYPKGDRLSVAVSDSGLGIMQTLRPTIGKEFPRLTGLSDAQLLVEIFRQGLSRHGPDRGCGLKGSAAKAIKFQAVLDVRLPRQRVVLIALRKAGRREIGGMLMAEQLSPDHFRIIDFSVDGFSGSHTHFRRDAQIHRATLDDFFERTGRDYERFNYRGEWHSHPSFSVRPSAEDVATMTDIVQAPGSAITFAMLLIVRLRWRYWLDYSLIAYVAARDSVELRFTKPSACSSPYRLQARS